MGSPALHIPFWDSNRLLSHDSKAKTILMRFMATLLISASARALLSRGIFSGGWRCRLHMMLLSDLTARLLQLSSDDGLCRRVPLEHTGLSLATALAAAAALAPAVARHHRHERRQLLLCQALAHLIAV